MFKFAIAEIKGKQYKLLPAVPLLVDVLQGKEVEAPLLLSAEDDKVNLGTPYLKNKIKLQVLGEVKAKKIRVAKYSAKANYRRVKGHRQKYSQVVYKA